MHQSKGPPPEVYTALNQPPEHCCSLVPVRVLKKSTPPQLRKENKLFLSLMFTGEFI